MLHNIQFKGADGLLELTERCNYNCPFCYCLWHCPNYPKGEELAADSWVKIASSLKKAGVKTITLTGGEPLLKEGFWDILSFCAEIFGGKSVSVYTNARLIADGTLEKFKALGISFSTSLQGLKTHPQMTGTKYDAFHTLSVIESASAIGVRAQCGLVMTSANKGEFVDMVAAALYAGAETILCSPVLMGGRALKNRQLAVSRAEWDLAKPVLRRLSEKVIFAEEFECACEKSPEFKNCPAGGSFFAIDPFGNVRKCLHASFIFGSAFGI